MKVLKITSMRSITLIVVSIIVSLGGFLFGFDTAVISGVVGFVKEEFHMSSLLEGWFVSSALLGCIIGVSFTGRISDKYGRKKALLFSALSFSISAMGCMLAQRVATLISFRFVGGVGVGMASMVSPLYISEFVPSKIRGRMVTLYQLAITVGILCAYFSNALLLQMSLEGSNSIPIFEWIFIDHVWRGMLGIGIIPSLLFFSCLFIVPESPRWLAMMKKDNKAKQVLCKIYPLKKAEKELSTIISSFKIKRSDKSLFFSPIYRTALIIGILLPLFSQWSGINAIIYYGPRILDAAGFTLGSALNGQIIIGIINLVFTFFAIFTIDRWGRRPLLLLGISLSVIALISIGFLFRFNIIEGPWILLFILIYIASFAFSLGPVVWVIIGEIFPTLIRGKAMALSTFSLWVANFFIGQLTPMMLDGIGASGTFWIFAILCSPALWLVWKVVPETKGKTLEEIDLHWKRRD